MYALVEQFSPLHHPELHPIDTLHVGIIRLSFGVFFSRYCSIALYSKAPSNASVSAVTAHDAPIAPVHSVSQSPSRPLSICNGLCAKSKPHLDDWPSEKRRQHQEGHSRRGRVIKPSSFQKTKASDSRTARLSLLCSELNIRPCVSVVASPYTETVVLSLLLAPRQPDGRVSSDAHLHSPDPSARQRPPTSPTADDAHVRARGRPPEDVQLADHETPRAPDRLIPGMVHVGHGARLVDGAHGARGRHGMHRSCRDRDRRALQ